MGTETRIGIATGLLIVVVASVYFFYGSDRSAEDLLIATGGPAAEPPKIPADRGDRLATSDPQHSEPAPQRIGSPPHRPTNRSTPPAARSSGRQARWKRPTASARQDLPPAGRQLPGSTRPQADPSAPASEQVIENPGKLASPDQQRLTMPLRTGPSEALVEATRNNLRPPSTIGTAAQTERRDASRGPAAAPTRPAVSWPTRHKISAGDTLSDISLRYYEASNQVDHILRANPGIKNPKALKIGDILVIPAPAPITQANAADDKHDDPSQAHRGDPAPSPTSASASNRQYRVQSGDTLYQIARKMLGKPSRWKEIYDQNREVIGKDPLRLKPGMMLTLPS